MNMKVFLASEGKTLKEISEILGCSYAYLCRVCGGHAMPSSRLAKDIRLLTKGKVILPTIGAKKKEERLLAQLAALRRERGDEEVLDLDKKCQ